MIKSYHLRYSIYKVQSQALSLSRLSLFILADLSPFVKHFFQILFKNLIFGVFLVKLHRILCYFVSRSLERSDIIPCHISFVNTIFHLFSIYFSFLKFSFHAHASHIQRFAFSAGHTLIFMLLAFFSLFPFQNRSV